MKEVFIFAGGVVLAFLVLYTNPNSPRLLIEQAVLEEKCLLWSLKYGEIQDTIVADCSNLSTSTPKI